MQEPVVLCAVDPRGVATVTFNRPQLNNAYNGDVIEGLVAAFTQLGADPRVRVVVLRGNGPHFQAGADLTWIDQVRTSSAEENLAVSRRTAGAVQALNVFERPTVALVHGGCFGGGIGIIAACDVVIAERSALFAISEARWGLHASIIIPQLNAAMGVRQVRRYALSCERFDAERAQQLGLVHELCEPGGLDEAAAAVLDALLHSEPGAVALTKRYALREAGLDIGDPDMDELVDAHARARQTEQAREGLASFAQKRKPAWYPST